MTQTDSSIYPLFAEWMNQRQSLFAHVDDERVNGGYAIAHHLYSTKQYEEACQFFRLLVQIRPQEAKYWKGFGATLQMLKMYEEALQCYAGAQILNKQTPDVTLYLYAADCYLAMNLIEDGLNALQAAEAVSEKTQNRRILNHIAFMRERWKKTPHEKANSV